MATNKICSSRLAQDATPRTQSTTLCPECSGTLVVVNRETRCQKCGLIIDEDQIDHGPEWFNSPEGSSRRRTGAPLTGERHDRGLSSEIGWHTDGQGNAISGRKRRQLSRLRREHRRARWRSKRKRNLAHGLGEVRRLVSALEVPGSICEQACLLFRRAQDQDLCVGRSVEGIAAASLYATCRCNGLGRTLDEISAYAQCSRGDLECAYSVMNIEFELPTVVPRPQNVLPRLASQLEVPDDVQYRALELATAAEEAEISIGCPPNGVAAACLYRAGQEVGYSLTQQQIADVASTSVATLRNHRDTLLEIL